MAIHKTYYLATIGSRTRLGGEVVTASANMELIALVGDKVRYPDGSETEIISGAGSLLLIAGRPAAIVGSELANGDRIVTTTQTSCAVVPDGKRAVGFLDPAYRALH
ncbi:MAG: PAAR domain-containing protein [Paludibacterium sp.]|uniref:PAAR domain-containing protein n=1 Tax=Paludibacterium sp. TaxID=1917523 RepID=UPI0025D7850A|nr:PAAR domain-containing protein [Paludibacterium sp.]MBV8046579.1 PAAR domain-containing protein [Paludibacterium sp.]MBV8647046.1 PAAR domain-containing protein [Paludibacterium sp.]